MTLADSRFFVTGGSLPSDNPSYVERKADMELYEALRRGEAPVVKDPEEARGATFISPAERQAAFAQAARKRVSALLSTGSCNFAGAQLLPPSAETSTCLMRPLPDQARPAIS